MLSINAKLDLVHIASISSSKLVERIQRSLESSEDIESRFVKIRIDPRSEVTLKLEIHSQYRITKSNVKESKWHDEITEYIYYRKSGRIEYQSYYPHHLKYLLEFIDLEVNEIVQITKQEKDQTLDEES